MLRWVIGGVALLAVSMQARSSFAQTSCLSTRVAPGSVLTTCQDPSRPAGGLDSTGIVTPESIGAWRALGAQRLRIEEQRLRNEILRRQSERAAEPQSNPLGVGTLAFASGLAGVDVWLDGQWRGRTVVGQRLVVADLSPGPHWIEVRVADRLWAGAITVEANERSVIDLESLASASSPTPRSPAAQPPQTPPPDRKPDVMACRSEATEVAGTADESDVWRRAFDVCVKRAGLVPLTPDASARVRALLGCRAEIGEVSDEAARTQLIRRCMASQGY